MAAISTIVAWYGLPGSGKSNQLDKYRATGHLVFDDFMKKSIRDNREFPFSRHFVDIVTASRRSDQCIIADIRLCEAAFRQDVTEILGELVPKLSIEWHCFDCRTTAAVDTCRDNVRFRAESTSRNTKDALRAIDKFAPIYSIVDGACTYPVVRARTARPQCNVY